MKTFLLTISFLRSALWLVLKSDLFAFSLFVDEVETICNLFNFHWVIADNTLSNMLTSISSASAQLQSESTLKSTLVSYGSGNTNNK